jgi:hypothetical protein
MKAMLIRGQVGNAIERARRIAANRHFIEGIRATGVQTISLCLDAKRYSKSGIGKDDVSGGDMLDAVALEFVMVWTFLFPLFSNPAITKLLDEKCPGFIAEMKDAFITLVIEGPFPCTMSGHQGRRHGARYHASSRPQRTNKRSSSLKA